MKLLTAGYSLRLLIARVNISDTKLLLYHNETRLFTKAARLFGCKTFLPRDLCKDDGQKLSAAASVSLGYETHLVDKFHK